MNVFARLANFIAVKPAAWIAGRFGGTVAAQKVSALVESSIRAEIGTARPVLISEVDAAVKGLDAAVVVTVDYVRTKIVAAVSGVDLSADAQSLVISTIEAVAAPVVNEAENLIAAFASAVKAAISAL